MYALGLLWLQQSLLYGLNFFHIIQTEVIKGVVNFTFRVLRIVVSLVLRGPGGARVRQSGSPAPRVATM